MKTFAKTMAVLAAGAAMIGTAGVANAKDGKAITWGALDYDGYVLPSGLDFGAEWEKMTDPGQGGDRDIVMVGCKGCNAYIGDRPVTASKIQFLCFVPGNEAEPAGWSALFNQIPQGAKAIANPLFYTAYSGGQIYLTKPIELDPAKPGYVSVTNRTEGDQQCKDFLTSHTYFNPAQHQNDADNARMAEWHDNGVGGHNMGARIHALSNGKSLLRNGGWNARFWIAINGQPSNVWTP